MDGYQSIVDMQLLSIEKTLLAAAQHLHIDQSNEIADLVAQLGMNIHSLMNKMQKASKRSLLNQVQERKIKAISKSTAGNRSFSNGISTRGARVEIDKQIQDYACNKLSHSLTFVLREKQRAYFEHWKAHWLAFSLPIGGSSDKASRVRFVEDKKLPITRTPSFMDAESSGKRTAVQRLISRHNGTSQEDLRISREQQLSYEGKEKNRDQEEGVQDGSFRNHRIATKQPSSLNDDEPFDTFGDFDEAYANYSPPEEIRSSDDEGEENGADSTYSPALYSAHDGAPLMLESIEDMYIGQTGPNTYATITTTGSLVNFPPTEEASPRSLSPVVAADTAGHDVRSAPPGENEDSLPKQQRPADSLRRDNRYTLPFSMDSIDDLYSQIVEMDNRNAQSQTSKRSRSIPMSPSRSLLDNMLSTLQPDRESDQVESSLPKHSAIEMDLNRAVRKPVVARSLSVDNVLPTPTQPSQTAIRHSWDPQKSAKYLGEQSHFSNFSPGGHVDGMEAAFELSP